MLYGFYLLPRYFQNLTDDIVGSIVDEYQNDIPYPDDLPQEVHRWTTLTSNKEIGSKCTIELAITHTQFYPNIRQILLLLLALPVGSCSCERSFSALRQ